MVHAIQAARKLGNPQNQAICEKSKPDGVDHLVHGA
jgi:hypothetical protein